MDRSFFFFSSFLLVSFVFKPIKGSHIQRFGKENITDDETCGFYCKQISFTPPFTSADEVIVFPSLSHENRPDNANKPSVVNVNYVDHNKFTACVMEPGVSSGSVTLNWFAIDGHSLPKGVQTGNVSYATFTSGSNCAVVQFSQPFLSPPKILLSVRHSKQQQRKDVMSYWAKDIGIKSFTVCLNEITSFSGKHEHVNLDWIAFSKPINKNMTDIGSLFFPNVVQPSVKNNHAYCQVTHYAERFYSPPVAIVSGNYMQNTTADLFDQGIVVWVKGINRTSFEVCVKEYVSLSYKHKPVTVDYTILGDLDPCIGVKCYKFSVCRAFGPYDARCICVENCPSTGEKVCASNGRTFDNRCLYQLEVCRTKANYSYFHPGKCTEFPMLKGRSNISQVPKLPQLHCQNIVFEPLAFYPDNIVHVQVSVSHVSDPSRVHDAAVSWVENVSENGFTVCVMESGRGEGPPHGLASIEWMAYQNAPQDEAAGRETIPEWWTGTKCKTVNISSNNFSSIPTVLVTAEHQRRSLKHDAASLWLEDVNESSFKVCLRELQNFDGAHQDIFVNWLALASQDKSFNTESGFAEFSKSSQQPLASTNFAYCQDVPFSCNYSSSPTVLISPKHNSSGGNLDPQNNAITAWLESITTSHFRVCMKEIFVNHVHDAVTLTYVVLQDACESGWKYRKGFCYKKVSHCRTWRRASVSCRADSSTLVDIFDIEEDVFVQHLHQDKESWTGLNDRANEGVFLWANGKRVTYTRWSAEMSSTLTAADCVYTFGRKRGYYWKTSLCDACISYTCKKDYDECSRQVCDGNADCSNSIGSYTCQCHVGYTGNGKVCSDVNECLSTYSCDSNAVCVNTVGSYICQCRRGYTGNGKTCFDIDECSNFTNLCDVNADCINSFGSYRCRCRNGYTGNGKSCEVFCGDPGQPYNGYRRGLSFTLGSTVTFYCQNYRYRIRGASSATCMSNSKWSNPTPTCRYDYYYGR